VELSPNLLLERIHPPHGVNFLVRAFSPKISGSLRRGFPKLLKLKGATLRRGPERANFLWERRPRKFRGIFPPFLEEGI